MASAGLLFGADLLLSGEEQQGQLQADKPHKKKGSE